MGDMADYYREDGLLEGYFCKREEMFQCRYCGEEDLIWVDTEYGWRLCDEEGVHVCPVRPAPEHRIRSSEDV